MFEFMSYNFPILLLGSCQISTILICSGLDTEEMYRFGGVVIGVKADLISKNHNSIGVGAEVIIDVRYQLKPALT